MEIDYNEIELVVIPTKNPPAHLQEMYLKAYYCWQEIWMVGLGKQLETLDFTKNKEMMVLFYRGECVAFCFLSTMNSQMLCENFSVHPKFRKPISVFNWREFFTLQIIETFRQSQLSLLATKVNEMKGRGYTTKKLGASIVKIKSEDYVVIDQEKVLAVTTRTKNLREISCPLLSKKAC
jgi:hypothetical protein